MGTWAVVLIFELVDELVCIDKVRAFAFVDANHGWFDWQLI